MPDALSCWGSRKAAARRFSIPSSPIPRLVAESLLDVGDPLETALAPGPRLDPRDVALGLARSVAPRESDVTPPGWLRPDQVVQLRRVVAALRRHRGALIADPTGSGKTWIALAAAQALSPDRPAAVVAPAILRSQWVATAAGAGVAIEFTSHEAISRGSPPGESASLLLLDESHRFRNPETRRYRTLAPWHVGRMGLLLTATPLVNRMADLIHQLLLVLPDDALVGFGCPSLSASIGRGRVHPSLGEVVLQREGTEGLPAERLRTIPSPSLPALGRLIAALDRLAFSRDRGTAALLRMGMCRALASSPAALAGMLKGYLRLLEHAAEAGAAGVSVSRATIRSLVGPDPDQHLMWELMGDSEACPDLDPGERDAVRGILGLASGPWGKGCGEGRLGPLRALLADGAPTVVFTTSCDTLAWLRHELRAMTPAWVSGAGSGIGASRLPRDAVLGWFGPRARPPAGLRLPQVLIATDVAAEGLDLQRASRVIHFDLPWTDVRLRQRAGRARRIGAGTAVVEVVTMPPAPPLERRLRQLERIVRKRELAGTAGLDLADPWLFRWRADIARWADGTGTGYGHAIVAGSESGWLAGLALAPVGESPAPANLLWFGDDGSFSDQPGEVAPRLLLSATAPAGSGDLEWDRLQPRLLAVTRSILASTAGAAWCPGPAGQLRKVLVRRLRAMARGASVSRDLDRIGKIERALTVVGGGLTSGEEILAERSASLPDGDLLQALSRLPLRAPPLPPALPVLTGIVRVASFSPCARSTPFCSTSMAPSSTPSS